MLPFSTSNNGNLYGIPQRKDVVSCWWWQMQVNTWDAACRGIPSRRTFFFGALLVEGHPLLVNIFRPEEGSKHQLLILKRRLGRKKEWRLWQMFDASGFTNDCNWLHSSSPRKKRGLENDFSFGMASFQWRTVHYGEGASFMVSETRSSDTPQLERW